MTDRQANDPSTQEFQEAAEKIEAANIADESASYTNAIEKTPGKPQALDQTEPEATDHE